ncbi:MAG: 50S ribosomal protein L22, partial [Clostridia bacterium]|nr:50S ribosomal protein L22 [Clostridia bacterium]
VSKCFVTTGSHMLKRIMPRGKGSANRILKRTSHITLQVAEKE